MFTLKKIQNEIKLTYLTIEIITLVHCIKEEGLSMSSLESLIQSKTNKINIKK